MLGPESAELTNIIYVMIVAKMFLQEILQENVKLQDAGKGYVKTVQLYASIAREFFAVTIQKL